MKEESVKSIVEGILNEDPRTRNDDKWLTIQVLRKMGFSFYIDYRDLKDIPAFETISKCRRKIQNEENKYNKEEFVLEEGVTFEKPI